MRPKTSMSGRKESSRPRGEAWFQNERSGEQWLPVCETKSGLCGVRCGRSGRAVFIRLGFVLIHSRSGMVPLELWGGVPCIPVGPPSGATR